VVRVYSLLFMPVVTPQLDASPLSLHPFEPAVTFLLSGVPPLQPAVTFLLAGVPRPMLLCVCWGVPRPFLLWDCLLGGAASYSAVGLLVGRCRVLFCCGHLLKGTRPILL
jgi:hypothetical protein